MSKTSTIQPSSPTSCQLSANHDSRWATVNLDKDLGQYAELKELQCVDLAELPIVLTRDQSRSMRQMMKDPSAGPNFAPRLLPMHK